jgi:branched-subunit amino acid ABC-type transport system permease component
MGTLSAFFAWWVDKGAAAAVGAIGMAFGFLLGAATEVAIIRPLARRSVLAVFVATIALFLSMLSAGVWGAPPDELVDSLFNDPDDFVRLFGTVWRYKDIGTLAVTLVITGLLLLFQKTRPSAMRGVASNNDSARLVSIPAGRILARSWAIAGALGALAAVLVAVSRAR